MDKEFEFQCENCGTDFTISTPDDAKPEICPFCGDDLNTEYDDYESPDEDC